MEELIKYYKENISEYKGKENISVPIDILLGAINEYYNVYLPMTEKIVQLYDCMRRVFPDLEDE